jgi:hypothetical protein
MGARAHFLRLMLLEVPHDLALLILRNNFVRHTEKDVVFFLNVFAQ